MKDYEGIQTYITQARIERSVYLAELTSDMIVTTWSGIKQGAQAVLSIARAKSRNNVFTFDS